MMCYDFVVLLIELVKESQDTEMSDDGIASTDM